MCDGGWALGTRCARRCVPGSMAGDGTRRQMSRRDASRGRDATGEDDKTAGAGSAGSSVQLGQQGAGGGRRWASGGRAPGTGGRAGGRERTGGYDVEGAHAVIYGNYFETGRRRKVWAGCARLCSRRTPRRAGSFAGKHISRADLAGSLCSPDSWATRVACTQRSPRGGISHCQHPHPPSLPLSILNLFHLRRADRPLLRPLFCFFSPCLMYSTAPRPPLLLQRKTLCPPPSMLLCGHSTPIPSSLRPQSSTLPTSSSLAPTVATCPPTRKSSTDTPPSRSMSTVTSSAFAAPASTSTPLSSAGTSSSSSQSPPLSRRSPSSSEARHTYLSLQQNREYPSFTVLTSVLCPYDPEPYVRFAKRPSHSHLALPHSVDPAHLFSYPPPCPPAPASFAL